MLCDLPSTIHNGESVEKVIICYSYPQKHYDQLKDKFGDQIEFIQGLPKDMQYELGLHGHTENSPPWVCLLHKYLV